ncbi:MAG: murein transglycosylase A [Candidatus Rifleibacteriota bacterium]
MKNIKKTFKQYICALSITLLIFATGEIQTAKGELGKGYEFIGNGKRAGKKLEKVFTPDRPSPMKFAASSDFAKACHKNRRVLAKLADSNVFGIDGMKISGSALKKTAAAVSEIHLSEPEKLLKNFDFFLINGEDGMGNVHFTGYFTPVLEVRKKPDDNFKYPIYSMPGFKPIPDRRQIDHGNALAGLDLEMAYSNSLLDNFFLSVQGSGVLDFGNGNRRYIGYAGQNGHPYRSVGKMLVEAGAIPPDRISLRSIREWFARHPEQLVPLLNHCPAYTFYKWRNGPTTGGAGVELTPMHSVAVDRKFIPYGACLLAEVPVLDANGNLLGHEWRILFAHDTGGAIKGPGHLDLYHGAGKESGDKAGDLHHYGRVWLILARE